MKMSVLLKNSIDVTGKTMVRWPKKGCKTLDMTKVATKYDGEFSVHRKVICFVHKNRVYVTPFTRRHLSTLEEAGLISGNFYVPFSNGDYPVNERKKWEKLMVEARGANHLGYEHDCKAWAEKHGIRPLKSDTMSICFRIPLGGVPVRYSGEEARIYPACKEREVDAKVCDRIGTFWQNNGKVVFVYRDGHTYVTRGHWIVNELREAGYREEYLFVPFSRGEVITDPILAKQWNDC